METEQARILQDPRLFTRARQRRAVGPFLDGMADRLRARLRALKPPPPPGRGLVVLRAALVDQALAAEGIEIGDSRRRRSRDLEHGYREGWAAGDRVALNPGVTSSATCATRIGGRR